MDADHDKPKVKEAERIVIPAFPLPESYRNWRIKVREAVCVASDRPDDALTAFSKKQTSVSMSSTESEVVAANVSLRAVGLPSAGLWAYLQNAGGISTKSLPEGRVVTKVSSGDYWIYEPHRFILSRVHKRVRALLIAKC